ncbi:MAG: GDP-mannose 4,6-dehydratase [Chloroflexi bacterium]|nr:GDP-mannose 4,6-dehydratase [Chloroflexota bacterium]
MRVLITGITGMAGSHLAEYVVDLPDVEVFGTFRWRSRLENLGELAARGKLNVLEGKTIASAQALREHVRPGVVTLVECDLQDAFSTRRLVDCVYPDRIFHLAAQSFVPTSFSAPAQTLSINVLGQVNLFEAILQAGLKPLIHVAGSSEEYGLVYPHEAPIKETNPLRPLSPYAVSKVAQEVLAIQYFRSYGLQAIVTRGFNHTGPRRGQVMVTSSFARQIAEIEAGLREAVVEVGDLSSRRDWTDVRDVVQAYWLALERCTPGEVYNVGSGTARTVKEMLEVLLGLTSVQVRVEPVQEKLRPSDVKLLLADASKFRAATGWEPRTPFEQTMADLLNYWRERVGRVAHGLEVEG